MKRYALFFLLLLFPLAAISATGDIVAATETNCGSNAVSCANPWTVAHGGPGLQILATHALQAREYSNPKCKFLDWLPGPPCFSDSHYHRLYRTIKVCFGILCLVAMPFFCAASIRGSFLWVIFAFFSGHLGAYLIGLYSI